MIKHVYKILALEDKKDLLCYLIIVISKKKSIIIKLEM